MIIFESRRICLITPPHTGSRALNRFAGDFGGQVAVGPTPDSIDVVDHHWARPPAECDGWTIGVVVRRPESRMVALFNHLNWWRTSVKCLEPKAIEWFVRAIATDDARVLSWLYRWSIVRLCGGLKVSRIVRFESLAVDVAVLLDLPTDVVNEALGDPPKPDDKWPAIFADFDAATRFAARVWCYPDAERFGYQRMPGEPFKRPRAISLDTAAAASVTSELPYWFYDVAAC